MNFVDYCKGHKGYQEARRNMHKFLEDRFEDVLGSTDQYEAIKFVLSTTDMLSALLANVGKKNFPDLTPAKAAVIARAVAKAFSMLVEGAASAMVDYGHSGEGK